METPLLKNGGGSADHRLQHLIADDGDYVSLKSFRDWLLVMWVETVKLWYIAAPIAFNIICQFSINSVITIFVGHIGDVELSAVATSTSSIGTFAFGFMLGMGSALETLCGQAFGAGKIHLLGIYMQRSVVILFFSCVVLLPIYLFAAPLLRLLGQHPEIADLSGRYTIMTIPQLFALSLIFPTQKFLQAQSKVSILAWIGFAALVLHIFFLWLFIPVLGWGISGAALAANITYWEMALGQVVYVVGFCKDGWKGFSWSAFHEIWAFVRLSLASAVMLCLEIWYMMTIIMLTGHLNNAVTAVGALSICLTINGWEGMVFIGINAAISVRVSNELGWKHPRAAKYSVYITVFQSLLIGLFFMILILVLKDDFAVIFTDSKPLQVAVSHLAFLLGITMVLNSVQPVISGVAIGAGWQSLVAYINLGSYYIFGIPCAFLLGYVAKLGVTGFWGGMIAGVALQTLLLLFVLYKTNWDKEVQQTGDRMRIFGGQKVEADHPQLM